MALPPSSLLSLTLFLTLFSFCSVPLFASLGFPPVLRDELMATKQTLAPVLGRQRGHRAAGQNSKVAISLSA